MQGGGRRSAEIVEALAEYSPDIVTLQEFRRGKSHRLIVDGLRDLGHSNVVLPEVDSATENCVLVSSALDIESQSIDLDSKRARRAAGVVVHLSDERCLNLLTVHFPQKKEQMPYFDALDALPSHWAQDDSLLIGDFNCGIPFVDSETKTFYATHRYQQLLHSGWIDSWRSRHADAREYSWVSTRKSNGFRYDHALASASFDEQVLDCYYIHDVREKRISDHSILIVDTA